MDGPMYMCVANAAAAIPCPNDEIEKQCLALEIYSLAHTHIYIYIYIYSSFITDIMVIGSSSVLSIPFHVIHNTRAQ